MAMLIKLAAFVVLLGALVFFHELGHFLVAKAFNVKVLKFSLGFGPRVWGFTRGETEYQLAALPLGGFVRMAGEDPRQELDPQDRGRGFLDQKPYRRALIALAGPAVNLLLPPIVYFGLMLPAHTDIPSVVAIVLPGEPADRAGLKSGDRILAVDGHPTPAFEQVREQVSVRPGETLSVDVQRGTERLTLRMAPNPEEEVNPVETVKRGKIGIVAGKLPSFVGVRPGSRAEAAGLRTFDRVVAVDGQPLTTLMELEAALVAAQGRAMTFDVTRSPPQPPGANAPPEEKMRVELPSGDGPTGIEHADLYLRDVKSGTASWEAGLRPGDRIESVNGAAVASGPQLERVLQRRENALAKGALAAADRPVRFTVLRASGSLEITFEPARVTRHDKLQGKVESTEYGFSFHPRIFVSEPFAESELVRISYGPAEAMRRALDQTGNVIRSMALAIGGIAAGRISHEQIGGPILLFQLAGAASERGLAEFLQMFALISVNLGLMNLLPVPALDGFHILISGVEGLSRRTVPVRAREIASLVGIAMLLALMLLAFKNDIVRTFLQ